LRARWEGRSVETQVGRAPSTTAMRMLLVCFGLVAPVLAQSGLLEKQMAAGERMARDFRKHTKPLEGAAEEYVRRVGRTLLRPEEHWQFELIKDDFGGATREPVTFPGYIFVPARLLIMTGSEAELAGMLAHAIAHLETGADEAAADRRAVEIAAAAGYNPRALADYLKRVPRLEARAAAADHAARAQAPRDWKDSTGAFADAQEFVRRRAVAVPKR
jgi:predicted Zn-dependent protease